MITTLLTVVGMAGYIYDNARADAKRQLVYQCEQLHGMLTDVQYGNCWESGDDGGYVNYMSCTASAECHVTDDSEQATR